MGIAVLNAALDNSSEAERARFGRRILWICGFATLVPVAVVVASVMSWRVTLGEKVWLYRRIEDRLWKLHETPPPQNLSQAVWYDWTIRTFNTHVNFGGINLTDAELPWYRTLADELDRRAKDDPIETMAWYWDDIAANCRRGKRYSELYRPEGLRRSAPLRR